MTAAYNKFLIDGNWVGPQDRSTLNVINPATEEAFATISLGTAEDVDAAVKACLLYTSPSPRDGLLSRMPSSA